MINTRGNTFSRSHERYTTSDPRFWRFSMDELATDDLSAVIAYVQAVTGAPKVKREFVTGNDLPRIVAHRCVIEASIGKRIVQTIE
jgi:hypothetical protein